jgi:hypothetical protein
VANACNPSYSGSKDKEDRGSRPAGANSLRDPISKNPSQKRAGGVAQGEDLEFKNSSVSKKQKPLRAAVGLRLAWSQSFPQRVELRMRL